jgi:hypothetical protein
VQRTGIVMGDLPPGEKPEERAAAAATLLAAVPGALPLDADDAAPSPVVATLLDALLVLDDVDTIGPNPLGWSPMPIDRSERSGALDQWLALAGNGPQRVLLPGMHTLAERGGRAPRRRDAALPGSELFYASCSLMSAGAETALLSRWRVGGQSTLDLVREFIQELPHATAAEAWQRSVQLEMEAPVDPAGELRVQAGREPIELTGKHPFFWSGYLVVDSGWRPDAAMDALAEPAVVAPGAAPPITQPAAGAPTNVPGQPPGVPPPPTPPAPAEPDAAVAPRDPTATTEAAGP